MAFEIPGISVVEVLPGARSPSPTPGLQGWEEESPQHLDVKISGVSVWVRWESAGNQGILLKGLCADSRTLNLSSSKGTAVRKVPGTHGKKWNCVASGVGLKGQPRLFLC